MATRQLSAIIGSSAPIAVPVLESGVGLAPPRWVTNRGSDVRAYDLTAGRNVYGPGHHFAATSDIRITNGIMRVDVGSRGVLAYLTVAVWKAGAWQAKGYLYLSADNNLVGASLVSLTAERCIFRLAVANEGVVYVRLHRGERMLRITHGTTRAPAVSCKRSVRWVGVAPSATAPTTGFGFGSFGSGAFGGTGTVGSDLINGSPLTAGLCYESTVDGGSTRFTDANGLTRGLAVLRFGASNYGGLGVQRTCLSYEVGAFAATAAAGDDESSYQIQLATASEQMTRVR